MLSGFLGFPCLLYTSTSNVLAVDNVSVQIAVQHHALCSTPVGSVLKLKRFQTEEASLVAANIRSAFRVKDSPTQEFNCYHNLSGVSRFQSEVRKVTNRCAL